jgi:hypothetical protein
MGINANLLLSSSLSDVFFGVYLIMIFLTAREWCSLTLIYSTHCSPTVCQVRFRSRIASWIYGKPVVPKEGDPR